MSEFKIRPGITDDEAKEILELNKKASSIQECRDNFIKVKYKEYGLESEQEFNVWLLHIQKGATYKPFVLDKNVRSLKHTGGSTEMSTHNGDFLNMKNRKKYIPPRYDMENIFPVNYNDILKCEPNKKFNKIKNLIFNHEYEEDDKQLDYDCFVDTYNSFTEDELNKLNDFYQRFSTYIIKNKICSKYYVDGSVICNISLMLCKYMNEGIWDTSMDFFNMMSETECNLNYDNRFYLFLTRQLFTSKNIYYKKFVKNKFVRDWWAVAYIRHRYSDRDMKTKGQNVGFRDEFGKQIYKHY